MTKQVIVVMLDKGGPREVFIMKGVRVNSNKEWSSYDPETMMFKVECSDGKFIVCSDFVEREWIEGMF